MKMGTKCFFFFIVLISLSFLFLKKDLSSLSPLSLSLFRLFTTDHRQQPHPTASPMEEGTPMEGGIQNGPEIQIVISPELITPSCDLLSGEARDKYLDICITLYQAALKDDWNAAKGVIEIFPTVVRSSITQECETALHIAAAAKRIHFVEELVGRMNREDLELLNSNGNTALCLAAVAGTVRIAEVMINKNERLPMIRGSKGMTPLYMAALLGHSDMVWYLYKKTKSEDLSDDDRIGILNTCVSTDLYDVALDILNHHPQLAVARDRDGETTLHVLARKPSAFTGGSRVSLWKKAINTCWKVGHDKILKQDEPFELVRLLWKMVIKKDDSEISDLIRSPSRLHFDAVEHGNTKFLIKLIEAYPDLIWKVNNQNQSIFHVAVLHRRARIFNILYEIGSIKDLIIAYIDEDRNNILHLAAKIAPPNQLNIVSGAALQMQRELLWFKEVEKIVQPSYVEMKNSEGKTPQALFIEEHKDLVVKGEAWMKSTASQSMVVATLIATVMFAAAFTVPGGNDNNTGIPMFRKHSSFMVFAISDAIALVTSSTSILMFLSILTSRYAENDFLKSLPFKLMIGLTTLFISITTMMVAFGATFFIVFDHYMVWVPIAVALFACAPVILFATLQYPLLADVIHSTYCFRLLFQPRKHMLY
ncbi:ankyrin repeat-containing protein At5g02620-like isoform X2 [Camellia sinensis]|uniref:ankyrin repeat-containing protein At5g02620-like isoform X2 n=1 Tax=Camellia sinensis TaxID=4442 RepID=UPI0010362D11|nr:ankyrin repeat-containing protein At5g02620-like isoform X2 [Camellia sinensis]